MLGAFQDTELESIWQEGAHSVGGSGSALLLVLRLVWGLELCEQCFPERDGGCRGVFRGPGQEDHRSMTTLIRLQRMSADMTRL